MMSRLRNVLVLISLLGVVWGGGISYADSSAPSTAPWSAQQLKEKKTKLAAEKAELAEIQKKLKDLQHWHELHYAGMAAGVGLLARGVYRANKTPKEGLCNPYWEILAGDVALFGSQKFGDWSSKQKDQLTARRNVLQVQIPIDEAELTAYQNVASPSA